MHSSQKHQLGVAMLMILWVGAGGAMGKSSPLANWQFSDPHYTSNQYAKILGESGVGHDPDDKDKTNVGLSLNPEHLQIQYVDYQPQCLPGGVPVCATNGTYSFYFENDCRLEAHNIKMLFQYGTELEPTELERCLPTCRTMKCTAVERPVCALAEIGGATPQTFANECEMRRRECHTKQVLRILHQGPCRAPTRSLRKKKQRRSKNKLPTKSTSFKSFSSSSKLASQPKKVYYMLVAPRAALSAPWNTATTTPRPKKRWNGLRITTTPRAKPSKATSTSPSPMQFQQLMGLANPMVSVSRAVDAYNVYNIPDVGRDYGEITDSSLSLYLPGVGRVTEPYATTTTTSTLGGTTFSPRAGTTSMTTTTPEPLLTTSRATTMSPSMASTTAELEEESTVADLEAVTSGFSTTTQEPTTSTKSP